MIFERFKFEYRLLIYYFFGAISIWIYWEYRNYTNGMIDDTPIIIRNFYYLFFLVLSVFLIILNFRKKYYSSFFALSFIAVSCVLVIAFHHQVIDFEFKLKAKAFSLLPQLCKQQETTYVCYDYFEDSDNGMRVRLIIDHSNKMQLPVNNWPMELKEIFIHKKIISKQDECAFGTVKHISGDLYMVSVSC